MRISKKPVYILLFSTLLIVLVCNKAVAQDTAPANNFNSPMILHDEWMGIYYNEKNIGYVHSVTEEGHIGKKPMVKVKSYAKIEMDVQGKKGYTELEQTGYLDGNGRLSSFEYKQNTMGHRMAVNGKKKGDELIVDVAAADSKSRKVFPFSDKLYTAGLLKYAILSRGLAVGDKVSLDILVESLLSVEPVFIKVLSIKKGVINGKETEFYTLEQNIKGLTGKLVITSEGLTLEESSPQGFKLLSLGKKEALADVIPLSIVDLFLASRIKLSESIRNPRDVKEFTVLLKKFPFKFPFIDDSYQKLLDVKETDDGVNYLVRIVSQKPKGKSVPIPVKDDAFSLYLKADHVANSDNKVIINKAREIIGNERSALKAARKIYRWVFRNIDKKLLDTVSSLDTLKTGTGECQAHANLFAALARSVGIPTKIISGIVYSEEYRGFMYHTWNEVFTGEWVSVDSTLGGFPVDATHLKLLEGGLAEQLKIMALVGKIEVEVVK